MVAHDPPTHRLSRRTLVAAGGALTVGLAGCAGGGGGGTTDLSQPADVPDDVACAVCNMVPAEFPDYNAQLSVEGGDRVFVCSAGCMGTYYVAPGHFESAHDGATFLGVWAHDHVTKELVDATTAWFVRETDADRVDDPMIKNPLPFADEADARAYVAEYDDLSASDVLRLDDFDMDLVRYYRGRFLE